MAGFISGLWWCAASSEPPGLHFAKRGELMLSWKRVIVGDAFRVPSRDFNYYRDTFLLWPFLLFTSAGLVNLFSGGRDHRLGFIFAGLSLLSILLARERLILIGGALGFCAVQSLLSFFLRHEWVGLAVAIPSGALFAVLIRSLKGYKPSYGWPTGLSIADLLVGLSSLGLSILVFRLMGRQ
jgi:hypothetical protein